MATDVYRDPSKEGSFVLASPSTDLGPEFKGVYIGRVPYDLKSPLNPSTDWTMSVTGDELHRLLENRRSGLEERRDALQEQIDATDFIDFFLDSGDT
jgi:hypothetical protein